MGPITIFDKSALQSLSQDEAVWLDRFFLCNITPLFYVETLADLEKAVREGRTPEQEVGALADKTPWSAAPNVHHRKLYLAELAGVEVTMDGRIVIGGGEPRRNADGSVSVHFDEFPEAAALDRWRDHEFLDVEREVARQWRAELRQQNHDAKIGVLRNIFAAGVRLSQLDDLKHYIDEFCTGGYPELVALVMDILDVPVPARPKILARWQQTGRPPIHAFAPYATHVFKVDATFLLGVYRGFIAGERPSNAVDMAYLYYLPFSTVFTSNDRLHARTVPLFLRDDQAYLPATDLKAALQELDRYFDAMPDEVKQRGVMQFATYPPSHLHNVVTELWDRTMRSDWRSIAREQEARRDAPRDQAADAAMIERIKAMQRSGAPLASDERQPSLDDVDQLFIKRTMPVRRGKWRMISQDVEQAARAQAEDHEAGPE